MDPLLDGAPHMGDSTDGFLDRGFFGTLDLAPLEMPLLDDPSREVQRMSLHDSIAPESVFSAKRGRGQDDSPRAAASNKMANTEPGDPVPLPAYGQNIFVGKDLTVTREARSTEQTLRAQVEDCVAAAGEEAARRTGPLRQALARCKEWAAAVREEDVWKPGTLAVLAQLLLLLGELEARLDVAEAERHGRPDSERCRLLLMQQDLLCPVFLKDPAGGAVLRLIAAPGLPLAWPPRDIAVRPLFDDGSNADVKLKLAGKPAAAQQAQTITIPSMSFEKGSRNRMVQLVFCAQVRRAAGGEAWTLSSPCSRPFVVTTSKKQWGPALGSLVTHMLFPLERATAPRAAVANLLQEVYLRSTHQDPVDPARPLSPHDFSYMFEAHAPERGDGAGVGVTREQFTALWDWFGSMLSRIRHDALVLDMWLHGYIMGFVTKEASDRLLLQEPPGTFILRFSSQAPGSFAIAYTAPEGNAVKHYLISKSDVNMACSLDVFLGEKAFFSTLLQTIPSFDAEMRWARVEKTKAFGKSFPGVRVDGYDEALSVSRKKNSK